MEGARTGFVNLDDMSDEALETVQKEFARLRDKMRPSSRMISRMSSARSARDGNGIRRQSASHTPPLLTGLLTCRRKHLERLGGRFPRERPRPSRQPTSPTVSNNWTLKGGEEHAQCVRNITVTPGMGPAVRALSERNPDRQVCSERTAKEFFHETCDCRTATCHQRR